jgi:hypothetical protein
MMEIKKSNLISQLAILIAISALFVEAMPTENSRPSQQTVVNEEMVTAYPDTQKRFVDLNYVSPEVSGLLQRSNLNVQQIREQQEKLKNRNRGDNERNFYDFINSASTDPSAISTSRTSRE